MAFLAVVIILRLVTGAVHVCHPKPFSCIDLTEDTCLYNDIKPHCDLKRRDKVSWTYECKPKTDLPNEYKAPSDFSFHFDCNAVNKMGIEMGMQDCNPVFCKWEYKLIPEIVNQVKQRQALTKFLNDGGVPHEAFEVWDGNKLSVIHWDPNKLNHAPKQQLKETVKTKGFQKGGQDTYSYVIDNEQQVSEHQITNYIPTTKFKPMDARIRSRETAKGKEGPFTTTPFNAGVFIITTDAGNYNQAGSGTFISSRVIQTVAHVVAIKEEKYDDVVLSFLKNELKKSGASLGHKETIIQPFSQLWLAPAWDGYTKQIKSAMLYANEQKCVIDKIIISHKYMEGSNEHRSDDIAWIVLKNDCVKSYIPIGFLPDPAMFIKDPTRYEAVIKSFNNKKIPFGTFGYPSDKGEASGHTQWQSRAQIVVSDWSKDDPYILTDKTYRAAAGQSGSGLFIYNNNGKSASGYVLVAMCQSVNKYSGTSYWNKITRERYYLTQFITGKSDIGGYKITGAPKVDAKSAKAHRVDGNFYHHYMYENEDEKENENEYIMDENVRVEPSYFMEAFLSLSAMIMASCILCVFGCIGIMCGYFAYPLMLNGKN